MENLLETSSNAITELNSSPHKITHQNERTNISFATTKNVVQSPTKKKLTCLDTTTKTKSDRLNLKTPSQLSTNAFVNNKESLTKSLRNTPSHVDASNINEWIAATSTPKHPVSTNMVLNCMKGICRWHFTTRTCYKDTRCYYKHKLDGSFLNNLRELNVDQFQLVLKEMTRYQYLFKDTFDAILSYYKENNHSQELVYLIEDILNLNFDKTPFVKAVVSNLKDLGYTFVDAISEILWTHGTKTQSLMDILLMIIVEEDDCLENNWHFVNKITKFRKEKLDYGVVTEIFQKCCNAGNPNRTFCENIYKDLIIKSHIELDKINRDLVIKYVNLLYNFNFTYYAEQLKQNYRIGDCELAATVDDVRNTRPQDTIVDNRENDENKQSPTTTTHHTDTCSSSSTATTNATSTTNSTSTTGSTANSEDVPDVPNSLHEIIERTNDETSEQRAQYCQANTSPQIDERINSGEIVGEERQAECEEFLEEDEHANRVTTNEMGDGYDELSKKANNVERCYRFEINPTYTHSDLETYLNYVNRDTYLTQNYYSVDEPPLKSAVNNVDTTTKQQQMIYKSSDSEQSFNRRPSLYTPGMYICIIRCMRVQFPHC